jgi:PncC family amidohydrolase
MGKLLKERGLTLATMESCTGGFLANTITDTPGSSAYFKGGIVSYTNEVKIAWGVSADLIAQHGAVSAEVAQAMASAVRRRLEADIGVGITGVAGPDESEGKPPGTVHIAVDDGVHKRTIAANYRPGRLTVKRMATTSALIEIRRLLLESR